MLTFRTLTIDDQERLWLWLHVALTVHPENPARLMYQSCGFRKVAIRNSYWLMVACIA